MPDTPCSYYFEQGYEDCCCNSSHATIRKRVKTFALKTLLFNNHHLLYAYVTTVRFSELLTKHSPK